MFNAEKDPAVQESLRKARETYSNKNQILVCMEELNELACVLAKFPRYADEEEAIDKLLLSVIDEVADVTIILEHVKAIFNIDQLILNNRIYAKVARLERWLSDSNSMQQTIEDRTVDNKCRGCEEEYTTDRITYETFCVPCKKAQVVEGKAVYYKEKKA